MMTVRRFLKGYDAQEQRVLDLAYRMALRRLGLVDRGDPICELVAQKITEVKARRHQLHCYCGTDHKRAWPTGRQIEPRGCRLSRRQQEQVTSSGFSHPDAQIFLPHLS